MLDKTGFDLWADGYDHSVGLSDESDTYPFAGYKAVLNAVYRAVMAGRRDSCRVLDLGFGTGTLTARLYQSGCEIWGVDFSPKMLGIAREKMPSARLFSCDLTAGLPAEILRQKFDFIVSTYALHHLSDEEKPPFLRRLLPLLRHGGRVYVGDVAFPARRELELCRAQVGDGWDEEEVYFVYEELAPLVPRLTFRKYSRCAGVLSFGLPPGESGE